MLKEINFSLGVRIFIAISFLIIAAVAYSSDSLQFKYVFFVYCLCISLACVMPGRIAQFFGSLVAAGILAAGVSYLVHTFINGPVFSANRGDESVIGAILFLVIFGRLCVTYIWKARFGFWRKDRDDD